MAVKLTSGAKPVPSLTSPQPQPIPYPPEELIAEKVHYGDRDILVTVPFPDTIVLYTNILNYHLKQPYETGGEKWICEELDKDLIQWVQGHFTGETYAPIAPSAKAELPNAFAAYVYKYDPDQPLWRADLLLKRKPLKGFSYGSWSVRLELSVSKAGPAGLAQLTSLIDENLPFQVDRLFGTMRVRRLDAAIDLIGAEPIDLIAHVKKPGKRMVFVGDNGRPESQYLYERRDWLTEPPKQLKTKTRGPLRLTLYERRSYFEQLALEPLWGACPYTRAEVQSTWTYKEPMLASLADLPNRFRDRRVAYAPAVKASAVKKNPSGWLMFCLAALGGGAGSSQAKLGPGQGSKFRLAYDRASGDLISSSRWTGWEAGLAYTGLSDWVQRAQAHSLAQS